MAISFEEIIAGAPPIGGDYGSEFARKINDNFSKVSNHDITVNEKFDVVNTTFNNFKIATEQDIINIKTDIQNLYAMIAESGTHILEFTSNISWTVPTRVSRVNVWLCGGGQGGQSGWTVNYNSFADGGTGGSGGKRAYFQNVAVTPGSSIQIICGEGTPGGLGYAHRVTRPTQPALGSASKFGTYSSETNNFSENLCPLNNKTYGLNGGNGGSAYIPSSTEVPVANNGASVGSQTGGTGLVYGKSSSADHWGSAGGGGASHTISGGNAFYYGAGKGANNYSTSGSGGGGGGGCYIVSDYDSKSGDGGSGGSGIVIVSYTI